jgi:MFS transporter, ACS family, tartrate transporter
MNRALGFSASQFGYGAGLFFAGYCFFEVPSNLALHRWGARFWIARIMIVWGLVSAGMAFVTGVRSFYFARFLLGLSEAGFFPGVTYFVAAWFPAQYRARILSWFLIAIPLSSLVGAPISVMLLEMDGVLGIAGWKWLFIVEGLPSVILGILVLRVLADTPDKASWLTESEKTTLRDLLASEKRERVRTTLWSAFKDVRVLILSGIQFGFTAGTYAVGIWLPLILKGHSLSNARIGLWSAVPYLFATIGMIVWAGRVDRSGRKIVNLTIACFTAAAGLALSAMQGSLVLSLIGMTVALVGATSARAIFWTIPTRFLTGVAAAAGLAFINSLGTVGGFVGPSLMGVMKDATGSFVAGILVMAGILAVTTALAASLKLVVREE